MSILKRLAAAFFGLVLVAGTVYLGYRSGTDSRFVVWFGISAAIGAPVGLTLFGYAIRRGSDNLVERLAKVPEIATLIEQAKTQEEKVKLLEDEHARLAEIVKSESRRQAIVDRVESLERDAVRIIGELDELDRELADVDKTVGESAASEEIRQLRERVKAHRRGDVMFRIGSKVYRVDRDIIRGMPFGMGNVLLAYFRILERTAEAFQKKLG